ncbi:tumor necrosis factor receptor superfamily member 9 isoform X2 [Brienomyrus brachyistius]|uniref:tumor necrosis factor receptor superfamily member 9 isoform X2 n=1 Tax=Brienomyrus brachyistius TaxID=42636 RepID=UPI0020B3256D|nr:tumor necrosis factor receptor superfamily member 9 isoform X2 [Brienomyrus brachyistius]
MGCHRWFFRSSKKGFHIIPWLLRALLLQLVDTSLTLKCEEGMVLKGNQCVPCNADYYWTMKQGQPTCEPCTRTCSAEVQYRVEIQPCGKSVNRECHCIQGTFCQSEIQYSCRRCTPCKSGTFTDVTSRARHCKPHKNCTQLGMLTIREGTKTSDSVCGTQTTHPPTAASKSPVNVTQDVPKNSTPDTIRWSSSSSMDTSSTNTPGTQPPPERLVDLNYTHYIWLLLFVVLVSVMLLGFFKRIGAKRVHHYWRQSLSKCVKDELGPKEEPELSCGGGPQQVTVGHSGGRDGVNNTVGTIHIYNPGTVVLGSNSAAQREEYGRAEEVQPLIGTPQQESLTGARVPDGTEIGSEESGTPRPPVVECTENEFQKELSYPIPATGK